MTRKEALAFINERNGKIFAVRFKKRTTGELREMACRQGVKSHLVVEPTREGLNFSHHALIPVFDMAKGAYRSIPIEGIMALKVDGSWVDVST